MKILLISTNQEKGFRPALPIGVATLVGALNGNGHEARCFDLCFETDLGGLIQAIRDFDPGAMGISIRNIDYLSILEPVFNLPFVRKVVECCRSQKPDAPLILGGPGFTLAPGEILSFTTGDLGIAGPGERSLPALLDRLEKGRTFADIPGLVCYAAAGELQLNPLGAEAGDFLPHHPPDRTRYDGRYFRYRFKGPTPVEVAADVVVAKRGCPQSCIYCVNSIVGGAKLTCKPPVQTVDEIEEILRLGQASRFEFGDGAFNMPPQHALEVCREMARRGLHFPWNCMFSPGGAHPQLLDLMAATGCDLLEMGSEAGSDQILRTLKKNFTAPQLREAHRMVEARGLQIEHCLFLGSPGETKETLAETFDLLEELVPPDGGTPHRAYFTLGYRLFKGTELYDLAVAEGKVPDRGNLAVPRFYVADGVLHDDAALDLIQRRVAGKENWYLWWGLPQTSLRDRVAEVLEQYRQIEELVAMAEGEEA